MQPRRFLFLQGNVSQFFHRLGMELRQRGHTVRRINFHAGDALYWRQPGAVAWRGSLRHWPDFLSRVLSDWQITDIVLFGDCRPLHRAAIRVAHARGLPVHVFEEGYLRPDWITLEQGGVNGYSSLPRDVNWYLALAGRLPPWREAEPVQAGKARRVAEDVLYHAVRLALSWRYPGYRTHRPWPWYLEFAGKLRRWVRRYLACGRDDAQAMSRLAVSGHDYFFFPLQLDSDSQIREHSDFGSMEPAIRRVLGSFARCAPQDVLLVVKEHPLDNGVRHWRRLVMAEAEALGISGRVIYVEHVDGEWLTGHARGVVTVNSTLGSRALHHGVPILTLGRSIYDLPGLTSANSLDDFWRHPEPPCPRIYDAFRRALVASCLINGGFFDPASLTRAVVQAATRLETFRARPMLRLVRTRTNTEHVRLAPRRGLVRGHAVTPHRAAAPVGGALPEHI